MFTRTHSYPPTQTREPSVPTTGRTSLGDLRRWLTVLLVLGPLALTSLLPAVDQPGSLTADERVNPLAVDRLPLDLGWQITSDQRGMAQTGYQIQVASSAANLGSNVADIYDSGQVSSSRSQHISYAGPGLASFQSVFWRVRVWNQQSVVSAWSPVASWSMGILASGDWSGAQWISAPVDNNQSPLMRRTFTVSKAVRKARLYVVGLGYHETFINGAKVGDAVLEPGWTYYQKRSYYVTNDITAQIQQGANAIGVELANGAMQGLTQGGHPGFAIDPGWIAPPRLLCKLLIEYTDNTTDVVVSNTSSWKWRTGPVKANDWYRAVTYDARDEAPGWSTAGFNDVGWSAAQAAGSTTAIVQAQRFPPCRVIETLAPISFSSQVGSTSTVYTCTFAKNVSGWLQLNNIQAPAGTVLRIDYYEPTDWGQWDQYTCKGGGPETWEPRFDYHGFNIAKITVPNASGVQLTANNVRARRVHSDLPSSGDFTSSNPVLGRLLAAARLSYLDNFVSIPTDCPTREKAGWMADAHLVAESGMYYQGNQAGYDKFMMDCRDGQVPSGGVPSVVPSNAAWAESVDYGGTAWSSAYPLIVWSLYERHGDPALLQLHYAAVKRYSDYITANQCGGNSNSADNGYIVTSTGLGDWGGSNNGDADSKQIITTSYHYQTALIVSRMAAAMGNSGDAAAYASRADTIKTRFNARFRTGGQAGQYSEAIPARAKACALFQGLVPDADRAVTASLLNSQITSTDWTWMGCLTPRWALQELTRNGYVDQAYAAVARTDTNWGRWTESEGRTTLREFWNGGTDNHAFMGSFATWFMEDLLGLRPDAAYPGFERFTVWPQLPTALNNTNGYYNSIRGHIDIAWTKAGANGLNLTVTVPPNCRATVAIPASANDTVTESGQNLAAVSGLTVLGQVESRRMVVVGSGTWAFAVNAGGGTGNPGTLAFATSAASVVEGNAGTSLAAITVTRSGGSQGAVGVAYATSNGSASAGSDYSSTSGSLNWADGDTSAKTFTVTISGDSTIEANETVLLTLSNPTGGAALGVASSTLTITNDDTVADGPGSGMSWERWDGIAGNNVSDLTSASVYTGAPSASGVIASGVIQLQPNLDNYGTRLLGRFIAPVSGDYRFLIASDDSSELWVSSDATATNAVLSASVSGWTDFNQWTKFASQRSAAKTLVAGNRYYVMVLQKEGNGGDFVQVGIELPGGATELPVPYHRFEMIVNGSSNTAPTITAVTNQTINEDGNSGVLAFTVGDAQTAAASLTVTASSSNGTLLPSGGIAFGGSGANRTVVFTPLANQSGSSLVGLTVSDGVLSTTTTFTLTVQPVNDAPTISAIADQSIVAGAATGPLAFNVGDLETPTTSLTLSANSSNVALVPLSGIVFGGSSANRTVTVTPAAGQTGNATITVTVSDGLLPTSTTFTVTVTPASGYTAGLKAEFFDFTSSLSVVPDLSTRTAEVTRTDAQVNYPSVGTAWAGLPATMADTFASRHTGFLRIDTAGSYTLSVSSDDGSLVYLDGALFINNDGLHGMQERSATATLAAGYHPLRVECFEQEGDAGLILSWTGPGIVTQVVPASALWQGGGDGPQPNSAPTISAIANQTVTIGTATSPLPFTVGDVKSPATALTLTATSSNSTLVPVAGIVFGGSGANRTVTITPAAAQSGNATITLRVGDGSLSTATLFTLTVTASPGAIAGLVNAWSLDEGSGLRAGDSQGGNSGTLSNGPAWTAGMSGGGLAFDGIDDVVALPSDLSPVLGGTATVTAWIKTSQVGHDTTWQAPGIVGVEQAGGGNDIFWGWIDASGRIGVQAGDGASAKSASPINDNRWHHLAFTRSAANGAVQVYVDGVLRGSATSDSGSKTSPIRSFGRLEDTGGTPVYFNGALDDLRIYNRILDASEIGSIAAGPAPVGNG